jgi:hypothetical protein
MPFRVLAWLRLLGVPKGKGFDKFDDKPCRPVPTLTPQQVAFHGGITKSKAFSLENAVKLYARTKPMSDKESEKVVPEKYESREFADFEPITTAQYEVLAQAAPLKRGKVIDTLLPEDGMDHGHEDGIHLEEFLASPDIQPRPLTAENLAAIKARRTNAEMLTRVEASHRERWKTILAVSAGAAGLVALLVGLVALLFAR